MIQRFRCPLHKHGWQAIASIRSCLTGPLKQTLKLSSPSLVQAQILAPQTGSKTSLPITCVHWDTRNILTGSETISAGPDTWPVEVGVVKGLPIPVPSQSPVLLASDSGRDGLKILTCTMMCSKRSQERAHSQRNNVGKKAEILLDQSQNHRVEGNSVWSPSFPTLHRPEWPALLSCTAKGGEEIVASGAMLQDKGGVGVAHSHPMAGHLGVANNIQQFQDRFHWKQTWSGSARPVPPAS